MRWFSITADRTIFSSNGESGTMTAVHEDDPDHYQRDRHHPHPGQRAHDGAGSGHAAPVPVSRKARSDEERTRLAGDDSGQLQPAGGGTEIATRRRAGERHRKGIDPRLESSSSLPGVILSQPTWTILCDFDGTISVEDVIDSLLDRFGRPGWERLEQDWRAGRIGSRECMSGQVALLDMTRDELTRSPGASCGSTTPFPDFVAATRRLGVPLRIVSDGLDMAIHQILRPLWPGRPAAGRQPPVAAVRSRPGSCPRRSRPRAAAAAPASAPVSQQAGAGRRPDLADR